MKHVYYPLVLDVYQATFPVDNNPVNIELVDVSGKDMYVESNSR